MERHKKLFYSEKQLTIFKKPKKDKLFSDIDREDIFILGPKAFNKSLLKLIAF